jgi:hypothetical protein
MANTFTKIATINPSGSTYTVTFSSIPQTYTDLVIMGSARSANTTQSFYTGMLFNGINTGNLYSITYLESTGTGYNAGRFSSANNGWSGNSSGGGSTANMYSNSYCYIPNYTGAYFKTAITETITETNAAANLSHISATLFKSTSAITSITLFENGGYNYTTPTSFTLYGVKNS